MIRFFILLTLAALMLAAGCSGGKPDPIVGLWMPPSSAAQGNGPKTPPAGYWIKFTEDGKFEYRFQGHIVVGSWEREESVYALKAESVDTTPWEKLTAEVKGSQKQVQRMLLKEGRLGMIGPSGKADDSGIWLEKEE